MPKIEVNFYQSDVGRVLRDLAAFVGAADLKNALEKVHAEVNRRRFVSQAMRDCYAIPLGLRRAYRYKQATGRPPNPLSDEEMTTALTFAASTMAVADVLSVKARERLSGMVRGSVGLNGDARRLQHELTAAAHFSQRGWDVTFADLEGLENFDYVVRKGDIAVEVECKTISGDIGNPIHRMDAANFMEAVCPVLLEAARDDHCTVNVTFPAGLPKERQSQLALASRIAACVRSVSSEEVDGVSIEVARRAMPQLDSDGLNAFAARELYAMRERENGHAGVVFNRKHLLGLCLASKKRVRVIDRSYETIKGACGQLTGKRAGHVWTHFIDLTDAEMNEIASSTERTALDAFSTRILKGEGRSHVSALSYSAQGAIGMKEERLPSQINRSHSIGGVLPTYYSSVATYPVSSADYP